MVVSEVQACLVTEESKNAGNERNNYRRRKRSFYFAHKLDAQVRHNFLVNYISRYLADFYPYEAFLVLASSS